MKYLKHKSFGFVPVIEVNKDHVVWDGNQWSRSNPPCKLREISPLEDFDLAAEFITPIATIDIEHPNEFFLSFDDESAAEVFERWWQHQGLNHFAEYLLDNKLTEN